MCFPLTKNESANYLMKAAFLQHILHSLLFRVARLGETPELIRSRFEQKIRSSEATPKPGECLTETLNNYLCARRKGLTVFIDLG